MLFQTSEFANLPCDGHRSHASRITSASASLLSDNVGYIPRAGTWVRVIPTLVATVAWFGSLVLGLSLCADLFVLDYAGSVWADLLLGGQRQGALQHRHTVLISAEALSTTRLLQRLSHRWNMAFYQRIFILLFTHTTIHTYFPLPIIFLFPFSIISIHTELNHSIN